MRRSKEWLVSLNLVSVCRKHFFHSFKMLMQFPGLCPGELWHEKKGGYIFWQQLLHALEGTAYWLRLEGDPELSCFTGKRVFPDLDRDAVVQLSKKQIIEYQEKVKELAESFFDRLTEEDLVDKSPVDPEQTQLDVVFLQIRHLQFHVGQCNGILQEARLPAVGWRE